MASAAGSRARIGAASARRPVPGRPGRIPRGRRPVGPGPCPRASHKRTSQPYVLENGVTCRFARIFEWGAPDLSRGSKASLPPKKRLDLRKHVGVILGCEFSPLFDPFFDSVAPRLGSVCAVKAGFVRSLPGRNAG